MKIYAWIVPTKIENPCQMIKPGKLMIQPQYGCWNTSPANNDNSNSPAKCYRTNEDQVLT